MAYLIFGFAIGAFVSGLIEKFYKNEATNWIQPIFLFLVSAISLIIFIYLERTTLQNVLERLFS